MDYKLVTEQTFDSHIEVARSMKDLADNIESAVELVVQTFQNGGKLLLAGNGGSAGDAQHWAAEWVIRLSHHLDRPSMPAIALTTDSSILTAGGNDIGFDNIFARQVEGLGQKGDLLIAISTSGNSENVIRASRIAKDKGMKVLGILGKDGGRQIEYCDADVTVPSTDTQRIQEMHVVIGHLLCELSERTLYEK